MRACVGTKLDADSSPSHSRDDYVAYITQTVSVPVALHKNRSSFSSPSSSFSHFELSVRPTKNDLPDGLSYCLSHSMP